MTGKPDCERCRRIQAAVDGGLSPHDAREANGWDECAADGCPMLPRPYVFKTLRAGLRVMPRSVHFHRQASRA